MRLFLAVAFALVACGPPAPSRSSPATRAADARAGGTAAVESVEEVATRLARAAYTGDRTTALPLILTFEEIARLTSKAAEKGRQAWEDEVTDFLDRSAREGREGSLKIVGAKVVKTMTLTPSNNSKVLRAVDVAVVELAFEKDGRTVPLQAFPLIFLKTDGGWKFSPTQ